MDFVHGVINQILNSFHIYSTDTLLLGLGHIMLASVFLISIFTKAYKAPHYTNFFRFENERWWPYKKRIFYLKLNSLSKRLVFLKNFLRPSSFILFLFLYIKRTGGNLLAFYKKFYRLPRSYGFFNILPNLFIRFIRTLLTLTISYYLLTYLFLFHLWFLDEKFNIIYNNPTACIVLNFYIMLILITGSYLFVGRFLLKKTIFYESPVRFSQVGEPMNIYRPDWNYFSILKLENPLQPGKLLTPEEISDLVKKYKSLDIVIDTHLLQMYGQYFISGQYSQDLKNLYYNPQMFGPRSFFYEKGITKKWWHELELQYLDRDTPYYHDKLDKADTRIPHWIKEPLESRSLAIQSILGILLFQLLQIWVFLSMEFYNILPNYSSAFWCFGWGYDKNDQFFFAPWLIDQTFNDYLTDIISLM